MNVELVERHQDILELEVGEVESDLLALPPGADVDAVRASVVRQQIQHPQTPVLKLEANPTRSAPAHLLPPWQCFPRELRALGADAARCSRKVGGRMQSAIQAPPFFAGGSHHGSELVVIRPEPVDP